MGKLNILLADDDDAICTVVSQAFEREGHKVRYTADTAKLLEWAQAGLGDAVITDVVMPSGNGLEMLTQLRSMRPQLPVIVISAQNTLMTAVKANELGAFDYLPKPFDLNDLIQCVEKSCHRLEKSASDEGEALHLLDGQLAKHLALIGSSPAIQELYRVMARLVGNDLTVLIEGESGTGKELVARALHQLGKRSSHPFVAVNMAAIPKELIESELFGHEKGAFTGAATRKAGTFAQAEGGTLFLDEIGDMPLDAQTKLLRVLQQGEFTPVGGAHAIRSQVRIVCATHRDMSQMVANGQFREDLYYRLNVVALRLPTLRERQEDIPLLVEHFLTKAVEKGLPRKHLDAAAMQHLESYHWPGNVRELENLIYRLAALCSEPVIGAKAVEHEMVPLRTSHQTTSEQASDIAPEVQGLQAVMAHYFHDYFAAHSYHLPPDGLYQRMVDMMEKPLLEATLSATHGNQLRAAKVLGINRNTLRKKMQQAGLLEVRS